MKKGLFYRVIVLVLVCTMLLGLTGFTMMKPDGEAEVESGEPVQTPTPGGDEDPVVSPEPSAEPEEPEPGEEPDPNHFTVVVSEKSKELIDVELPEDGVVQKDAQIIIKLKQKHPNVDMAVCANGQKLEENEDGTFTNNVTEDTVLYAFGIGEVTVSDGDMWKQTKTVQVATVGEAKVDLSFTSEGVKIAEKDGVFTVQGDIAADVKDNCIVHVTSSVQLPEGVQSPEQTKVVTVNMLDNTPPTLEYVSSEYIRGGKKSAKYEFTYKVHDALSGVKNEKSFTFWRDDFTPPETAKDSITYDPDTKMFSFVAVASTMEGLNLRVTDQAGNVATINGFINRAITLDVTLEQATLEEDTWTAGPNSKLNISGADDAKVTIQEISENGKLKWKDLDVPETLGAMKLKDGQLENEHTYTFKMKAEKGSSTAEQDITILYDTTAPTISDQEFCPGENWLQGVIHKITGGWMFNKNFRVKFSTDADVFQYAYKSVANGEVAPEEVPQFDRNDETWNYGDVKDASKTTINISPEGTFTGSVYLYVWDKAGNISGGKFTVENGDGKFETITNIATKNDSEDAPQLTVMAKTPVMDENDNIVGYEVYSAKEDDAANENWVKRVDFAIGANLPATGNENLDEKYDFEIGKDEDGTPIIEPRDVRAHYTYSDFKIVETHTNNGKVETAEIDYNLPKEVVIHTIGGDQSQSFAGDVTFTLKYTRTTTKQYKGDNGEWIDIQSASEDCTGTSVSVYARIQDHLNDAAVMLQTDEKNADGDNLIRQLQSGEECGWYNDYQNTKLEEFVLKHCENSAAPSKTNYTLTRMGTDGKALPVSQGDPDTGTLTKTVDNTTRDESGTLSNFTKNLKEVLNASGTGIYTLTVWSDDAAGNKTEAATYTIKYDNTAPEIAANFTEEPVRVGLFYKMKREVTINVTDEAFTGEEAENKAFDVDFKMKAGTADPKDSHTEWEFKGYTDAPGGVWKITYIIGDAENSGKYGDEYEVTVSVADNAGNTAGTDAAGQFTQNGELVKVNDKVLNKYSGKDVADFNLDQIKPVVSVSFDNNSARNGKYFAAGRTATITVTEHNFDPINGVKLDATGASGQSEWVSNGDVHTKTVSYQNDADCKFSIEVVDKAGNKTTDTEASYSGVATGEFVIDKTAPTINVTGTDTTPYPDACTPGISGHDTNMSSEYTLQLTRTVRASRNEDVTALLDRGNVSVSATDINAVFANIPDDAANDGIYVLTVSVTDMAGNTTQTTSTFTVNRHGSFYVFNDALADVVNAKYVQKADGSYTVTEYNASPLVDGSVKIEFYRDGELIQTLKPSVGAGVIGASGLYEYTYDLPAENFAQDGRYRVAISSKDEANNESDSTKLEDSLLEFTVDSVAPEITMIKGLEKSIVNADRLDVQTSVIDTYGIASIQILVDGEVVKEYVTEDVYNKLMESGKTLDHEYAILTDTLDFSGDYVLNESKDRQNVVIVVTDMAGNVTRTDSEDFSPVYDFNSNILVSTSFWARYIHNPVAIVITVVVILIAAGAIWYIVAGKKKKAQQATA